MKFRLLFAAGAAAIMLTGCSAAAAPTPTCGELAAMEPAAQAEAMKAALKANGVNADKAPDGMVAQMFAINCGTDSDKLITDGIDWNQVKEAVG